MDGIEYLVIFSLATSFFISLYLTKIWIRAAKSFGMTGIDRNKIDGKQVSEEGGIAVLFGILSGIFVYIFFKTFYLETETHLTLIFAVMCSLLFAGFLGFIDGAIRWKKGLKQWQKPFLTLPAAIPLMVLAAGHSTMILPFFGRTDVGILYPLIFIPIGIMGAANGFNMLAGMNGLEAGMGTIILSTIGIAAFLTGVPWVSLIAFSAVAALLAFLIFNKYPAKVFPGDSLTYSIGALIAITVILGNMERIGLFLFAPYFIELVLKARYKFKAESFGIPQPDGTLKIPEKIGSLTHIYAKVFKTEKATVRAILATQACLGLIALFSMIW